MQTARGPGQRAGLSRPAIVAAARAHLADHDPDSLSMRSLARDLGVAPNALYSYVATKADLLDHLTDDLLGDVEVPDPEPAEPLDGVLAIMTATYEVLVRHPRLVPIYLARQGSRGPNAMRLGELVRGYLTRAGVSGSAGFDALRVLIIHTIGSAAFAVAPPGADPDTARPITDEDARRSFLLGLRWLVTGIAGSGTADDADRPAGARQ